MGSPRERGECRGLRATKPVRERGACSERRERQARDARRNKRNR